MSTLPDSPERALSLPERTQAQLDELVRVGQFTDLQAAVATAVDRLYTETQVNATQRQQASARLNGALRLGTTRESLQEAEQERLDWESEQRSTHGPSSR
jgi:Arc/MetJ-type ribon-helix-helix transcriptional regulator